MSRFGLDYAWGRLTPAQHKAVGSSFAVRYLSHDPSKNLTKAEADELRKGGVDIVAVWETTATRASEGMQAGVDDAHAATAMALGCGKPAGRPIYFAVDHDYDPAVVDAYFEGVRSVLGNNCGPYGSARVCAHLLGKGHKYAYQTYAWSGGAVTRGITLYQYSNNHTVGGVGCDYNRTAVADFGQWGYRPPAPKSPQGTWAANVIVQMPQGHAQVEHLNGTNVHMGEHNRRYAWKLTVGEKHGDWEITPLPFVE